MTEGDPGLHRQLEGALEQNRRLAEKLAERDQRIHYLEAQVQALLKRIYGASSEKIDPGQLDMFLSGEERGKDESSDGADAPEEDGAGGAKGRGKKRDRGREPRWPENLKVIIESVEIPEEVRANPDKFQFLREEHSDIPDYIPGCVVLRRTVRLKFKEIGNPERPPLIVAAPAPPIPGVRCGTGLMAQVLFAKFILHQPLYRQAFEFRVRYRVCLPRQTLDHWVMKGAARLQVVAEAVRFEVLCAYCIQFDDTPIRFLEPGHGKTRLGRMWIFNDPGPDGAVFYRWATDRTQEGPREFLIDAETGELLFKGNMQGDFYEGNKALVRRYEELELVGCMAHLRRYFVAALEAGERRYSPLVILAIRHLYRIEDRLKEMKAGPALRDAYRCSQSAPIMRRLHRILLIIQRHPLPKSKLGEGVSYALKHWPQLTAYLEDGRLEIDNTGAERAVRPTKLGMKNWLFIGDGEAGWTAAVIYTLVENCKRYGLDPYQYLVDVLEALPRDREDLTVEEVAHLTPARMANAKPGRWKNAAA